MGAWDDSGVTTRRVRARLVTTHAVEAYGGVQLAESVVAEVADAVGRGIMPMHVDHDRSKPLQVSNLSSGTERLPDGHLAAWAEFDVDAVAWEIIQEGWREADAPGGMSISLTTPLSGGDLETGCLAVVAADAHHFTESQIKQAADELRRLKCSAGGELLYQFSYSPAPVVLFDLVLPAVLSIGPNLAAAIIYDAAKHFFTRPLERRRIVMDLTFRKDVHGERLTTVHVEADSAKQVRASLDGLPALLEAGSEGTFTSAEGGPLRPLPEPDEEG